MFSLLYFCGFSNTCTLLCFAAFLRFNFFKAANISNPKTYNKFVLAKSLSKTNLIDDHKIICFGKNSNLSGFFLIYRMAP